jgi:hypothetical protein
MAIPAVIKPHPDPNDFSGIIHFRGAYAYYQDAAQAIWALLQFDSPFSGDLNFTMAAQTAQRLASSYSDNDPIKLHGVLVNLTYDGGAPLAVLFLF